MQAASSSGSDSPSGVTHEDADLSATLVLATSGGEATPSTSDGGATWPPTSALPVGVASSPTTPPLSMAGVTDPRLRLAYQEAVETGSMTPLLKEELRLSILARRMARGAEEVPAADFKKPVSHSLTPQEEEKRARRRQQNRDAALKFRLKRKHQENSVQEEYETQAKRRRELKAEIASLTAEKEKKLSYLRNTNPRLYSIAESIVSRGDGEMELAAAAAGSEDLASSPQSSSQSSPQPSCQPSPQPFAPDSEPGDALSAWSADTSLALSPGLQAASLQNDGMPSLQNAGMPSLQNDGMPSLQNDGMPSLQNDGMPSLQNAGMPSLQNAGIPNLQNTGIPSLQNNGMPSLQNAGVPNLQNAGIPNLQNAGMPSLQNAGMPSLQAAEMPSPQAFDYHPRETTPDVLQLVSGSTTVTASETASVRCAMAVDDSVMYTSVEDYDDLPNSVHVQPGTYVLSSIDNERAQTPLPLMLQAVPGTAASFSVQSSSSLGQAARMETTGAKHSPQTFSSRAAEAGSPWNEAQGQQTHAQPSPSGSSQGPRTFAPFASRMSVATGQPERKADSPFSPPSSSTRQSGSKDESKADDDEFSRLPKVFDPFELLTEGETDQDPKPSKMKGPGKRTKTDPSKVRVFDTNLRDLTAVLSPKMSFEELTHALFPHIKILKASDAGFKDIARGKKTAVKNPPLKPSVKNKQLQSSHTSVLGPDPMNPSPASQLKGLSVALREPPFQENFKENPASEQRTQDQGLSGAGGSIPPRLNKERQEVFHAAFQAEIPGDSRESLIIQESSMAPLFVSTGLPEDLRNLQDLFSAPQETASAAATNARASFAVSSTPGVSTLDKGHSRDIADSQFAAATTLSPGLSNLCLTEAHLAFPNQGSSSGLEEAKAPASAGDGKSPWEEHGFPRNTPFDNPVVATSLNAGEFPQSFRYSSQPESFQMQTTSKNIDAADTLQGDISAFDTSAGKSQENNADANFDLQSDFHRDADSFATPTPLKSPRGDPMISGQPPNHGAENSMSPLTFPAVAPQTVSACTDSPSPPPSQGAGKSDVNDWFLTDFFDDFHEVVLKDLINETPDSIFEGLLPEEESTKRDPVLNPTADMEIVPSNWKMEHDPPPPRLSTPECQESVPAQQQGNANFGNGTPSEGNHLKYSECEMNAAADPGMLQTSDGSSRLHILGGQSWNPPIPYEACTVDQIPAPVAAPTFFTPSPHDSMFETFGPTKPQAYTVGVTVSPLQQPALYSPSSSRRVSPTSSPPTFGPLTTVDVASLPCTASWFPATSWSLGSSAQETATTTATPGSASVETSMAAPEDPGLPGWSTGCGVPGAGVQPQSDAVPAVPVGMLLPPEKPGDPPRLLVSGAVFSQQLP